MIYESMDDEYHNKLIIQSRKSHLLVEIDSQEIELIWKKKSHQSEDNCVYIDIPLLRSARITPSQ